jgi:adenylate cyclase
MVGKSLDSLVHQNRLDTLAHVTIYGLNGSIMASTLLSNDELQPVSREVVDQVLSLQDQASTIRNLSLVNDIDNTTTTRDVTLGSVNYSELLGPWEARGGEDLGVIGISLAENFLIRPTFLTSLQTVLIVTLAFLGVIAVGIFVANQITHPLSRIVQASSKVARGDLEIRVPAIGNDEVAVLAHAFNYMVSGLQEGFIYRDLLGRTVSPEVREALRRAFASGNIKLEGQNAVATVVMSDIRGFTTLSEKEDPTTILNWLNEYFGELVPVITSNGGVVDKFEGDAMLAFFGILPTPILAEQSAYQACKASLEMLKVIERINIRRAQRGEPPFITGIGVNTGTLIAGGLGTTDRLNYTIIGNTVNTTQRMQELTRPFGESGIVIGENTLSVLKDKRNEFHFEPMGEHAFPGKAEQIWVYRLLPVDGSVSATSPILSQVESEELPGSSEPTEPVGGLRKVSDHG